MACASDVGVVVCGEMAFRGRNKDGEKKRREACDMYYIYNMYIHLHTPIFTYAQAHTYRGVTTGWTSGQRSSSFVHWINASVSRTASSAVSIYESGAWRSMQTCG